MKTKARGMHKTEDASRWDALWEKQFAFLLKFNAKNKRWPKVTDVYPAGNRIGQWVNRQRDLRERGDLEADRTRRLQKIGFDWKRSDERGSHWDKQYQYLLEFRRKNIDHWPYARQDFPVGNRLGLWVWRQRQAFTYGHLPKDRKLLLEKIKFPFELPDSWSEHFKTLQKYRAKFPNRWPKAREEFPKGSRLGLWCHLQRCAFKVGKLLSERKSKLEKMGFQWSVKQVSWTKFYDQLRVYKKKHASYWPALEAAALEDRRLIAWCSTQRHKFKVGKLDKDKIALLDKIGFRW